MGHAFPDHLHLGCGLVTPDGWLNVDGSPKVMLARHPWLGKVAAATGLLRLGSEGGEWSASVLRLDLARPLPFPAGTFSAVYSSHLLEHLHHGRALDLLKECHRVLRTGGVCRAVVPDLEALVARYRHAKEAGDEGAATRFMEEMLVHDKAPPGGLMGAYFRLTALHQHKWAYDAESLALLFRAAGFGAVRRAGFLESRIARIGEVEDAGRILDGQGVAVEGIRE